MFSFNVFFCNYTHAPRSNQPAERCSKCGNLNEKLTTKKTKATNTAVVRSNSGKLAKFNYTKLLLYIERNFYILLRFLESANGKLCSD